MSEKYVAMEEVLRLLESGAWELGYSDGIRSDGRYWMQKGGLSKGGETRGVRSSTVRALERRKLVRVVPRTPSQPFWLRRYELIYAEGRGEK